MNGARHELLARSALAADETVERTAAAWPISLKVRIIAGRVRGARRASGGGAASSPFVRSARSANNRSTVCAQLAEIERLHEEFHGARPHRRDDRRHVVERRHHDHVRVGDALGQELQQLEAVEPRHPDVAQHDVRTPTIEPGQGRRRALRRPHLAVVRAPATRPSKCGLLRRRRR